MPKIKVELIGVGNCTSATVQGVYHPRDIEFVSAFDSDAPNASKSLFEGRENNNIKR